MKYIYALGIFFTLVLFLKVAVMLMAIFSLS